MKRFFLLALLLAATVSLTVQCTTINASEKSYGSEAAPRDIIERNLKINKEFSTVEVSNGVKLFYSVGKSNSVRIVGPEELVERTVVTVEKGALFVDVARDRLTRGKNIGNLTV